MAKASRKRSGSTNGQTPKPRREIWGIAPNGEFVVRDQNGNRVPVDPNEKVRIGRPLTPEQLEYLARLPVRTATAGDLVRSSIREKTESWEQRREAQRQQEFQETLGALADAIASRVERPKKKRTTKTQQAEKSKAEQRREDEKRGDEWLRGRNCGQYVTYNDMAVTKGIELWDLKASLERDRHHRADVWAAKKKPRRKKAVKTR